MDRLFWRAARAQVRARTFGARQGIFRSQEMSFDYLIAFIAQKLVKIDLVEFWSYLKIFNILKKKVDFTMKNAIFMQLQHILFSSIFEL